MSVVEYYRSVSDTGRSILEASLVQDAVAVAESHHITTDMAQWTVALSSRPEVVMLQAATKEIQFALLALLSGQYRHAFSGIRSYLELSLASCLFGAHEFYFRLWEQDMKDIRWSEITDSEKGIFSIPFARAFFPDMEPEQSVMGSLASKLYRECSQYVHLNFGVQSSLPAEMSFDEAKWRDWHDKTATARLVVNYSLSLRYLNHLNLEQQNAMESVVTEQLGTLAGIQSLYSR